VLLLFGRTTAVADAAVADTSCGASVDTLPPLNSCVVDAVLAADDVEAAEAVADVATPENIDELALTLVAG
jgi:hypothetical protein